MRLKKIHSRRNRNFKRMKKMIKELDFEEDLVHEDLEL